MMHDVISNLIWLKSMVGNGGIVAITVAIMAYSYGICYNRPITNNEKRDLLNAAIRHLDKLDDK